MGLGCGWESGLFLANTSHPVKGWLLSGSTTGWSVFCLPVLLVRGSKTIQMFESSHWEEV